MCLDTIEKEEIINEDLVVFKTVLKEKKTGKLFCGLINRKSKITEIKEGENKVKKQIILITDEDEEYESGFHCNIYNNNKNKWIYNKFDYLEEIKKFFSKSLHYGNIYEYFDEIQIKVIIPKGTKVTIGYQYITAVIVTPVFIYNKQDQ